MRYTRVKYYLSKIRGLTKAQKKRNFHILHTKALDPSLEQQQIVDKLKLNISRPMISYILSENQSVFHELLLEVNPLCTTEGRVAELIKMYNKRMVGLNPMGKKDAIDITKVIDDHLRKDSTNITIHSTHNEQTINVENLEYSDICRSITERLRSKNRLKKNA